MAGPERSTPKILAGSASIAVLGTAETGMPAAALPRSRPALLPAGQTWERPASRTHVGAGRHVFGRLRIEGTKSMLKLLKAPAFRAIDKAALFILAVLTSATIVQAFTAPAVGDLGYDIYDIVVNQGVKGPLGFVGGVAAFLFGVSRLFSNIMIGIPTIVAAVCLIKADSILQTFGMVI
jgi:hypothetical protein